MEKIKSEGVIFHHHNHEKNDRRYSGGTLRQKINLNLIDIRHLIFDIQPMDQWTNGPMEQWIDGPMGH